jgi:GTP-binding protein EngB required for normal cell division
MSEATTLGAAQSDALDALDYLDELCRRYQITSLDGFRQGCAAFAEEGALNVAILGRFKAGKSSFLNHLFGKPLLPVGVVPVTTVVTVIEYGPQSRAEIVFKNGRTEQVPEERIGDFISEAGNPENFKQVERVRVELSELERYRGIRFVDTPGLESVLRHNTETSLEWLPKVGLALVAVGVDPPLSEHDIELIQRVSRYTPDVAVLLTKVDVLNELERSQVQEFVQKQLARYWDRSIPLFRYSIRPGFEHLRAALDAKLLSRAHANAHEHHAGILRHKIDSLLSECAEYLTLALKTAEIDDSERKRIRDTIVGEKEYLEDTRHKLRLAARHAAATSRTTFETLLERDHLPVRQRLLVQFNREFSSWTSSLTTATQQFDAWLCSTIGTEMASLSSNHREEFVDPVRRVSRQLSESLQDFRNRMSERSLQALGVPLRTSEMELCVEDPKCPDVRVGKIFDRNWELLSWVLPMVLIKGLLRRHFEQKICDVVAINLSRLASQWEEIVNASLSALEKEAIRRFDGLVATIENLTALEGHRAAEIRADLASLAKLPRRTRDGAVSR